MFKTYSTSLLKVTTFSAFDNHMRFIMSTETDGTSLCYLELVPFPLCFSSICFNYFLALTSAHENIIFISPSMPLYECSIIYF